MSHLALLSAGLVTLIAADLVLAGAQGLVAVALGVAWWGLHLGMTQGLLATMVADTAPAHLRGTAFGFFNLASGIAMLSPACSQGLLWDQLGPGVTFYAGAHFLSGRSADARAAKPALTCGLTQSRFARRRYRAVVCR